MHTCRPFRRHFIRSMLAAILVVFASGASRVTAQTITQVIDSAGDGAGNPLTLPTSIAVDTEGNAFVTGKNSHNVFKIRG